MESSHVFGENLLVRVWIGGRPVDGFRRSAIVAADHTRKSLPELT